MYNLDLFDDVTVTLRDVELWLRAIPRLSESNRPNAVLDYCINYDVVKMYSPRFGRHLALFPQTVITISGVTGKLSQVLL